MITPIKTFDQSEMIKCMYQSLNVWGGINHILHHCYGLSLMHIQLSVISIIFVAFTHFKISSQTHKLHF